MWDLAVDGETGDLLFSPTRDLLGAVGDGLTRQRILVRCKIPRGTWVYDEIGTLGSNLYRISRSPGSKQIQDAPGYVREAVADMDDIQIHDVQVQPDENNRLVVNLTYSPVVTDEDADDDGTLESGLLPDIDTSVTI